MPLFNKSRKLRVVAFFSGGASGFRYLANHDPNFGDSYSVVGGFTDDPECPGVAPLQERDIPVATHDIRAFYEARGAERTNLDVREDYDAETAERIQDFDPDLILLSGYMWILTEPVIGTYPTINVHPADLTITDDSGDRKYVGFDPVHDAIRAGEAETRSSVHFVTPEVDAGPILVRSKPHPVHTQLVEILREYDAADAIEAYAEAHQEWMKWTGDGPALATAVSLIADGRVTLDNNTLEIDGGPGPVDLDNDE